MKLEKAIEIKLQWRKDNYPPALADEMNADMLSIEALKAIRDFRKDWSGNRFHCLPGETGRDILKDYAPLIDEPKP